MYSNSGSAYIGRTYLRFWRPIGTHILEPFFPKFPLTNCHKKTFKPPLIRTFFLSVKSDTTKYIIICFPLLRFCFDKFREHFYFSITHINTIITYIIANIGYYNYYLCFATLRVPICIIYYYIIGKFPISIFYTCFFFLYDLCRSHDLR